MTSINYFSSLIYKDADGIERAAVVDLEELHALTWSPAVDVLALLPFRISGATYAQKKTDARRVALEWQTDHANRPGFTWGDIATAQYFLELIAARFGLRREFRRNGII